ncbi:MULTISPECIES: adenylosuccinate synthase [Weeksella]|uniref:Adenylosuccinate synthetase n=1 Tax=Weeksella virosa (strain ATCC 43766 / DSM 16922 / JCM 21250 / CCUG 30538 / CDC 9751 / IAM 14551 / NBRC 16016 / NCTC 11634 / CL345/78) TaxID=865938 RepID=F0P2E1_WEEVC|nr:MULTISPECIES: adenylosuccinate synthase [Weeksella]ADX66753.1 Adenylosuccinate synthetase [Weeksella virosa DSM 16922]MDK7374754.1 adenylosuccinate synthase [Weeksella virosa]MDK7675156.1 adenylosuccinate synthase [Weeksella virosa]OFM85432.1 adenylosuccinate synthase [Weeksella sp. HMSC059D05]SUP53012.1 Adenylosuccinate synthetase [Weeksella virosa]
MSTNVVVGLQWGDEGKGKITDVLAEKSDYVVRYQGGNNAGHTVYVGDDKFVLHLLPSGVLQCKGKCIIANGVVVNPEAFFNEIEKLEARGQRTDHVFISRRAHIIMPYHVLLDEYREEFAGKDLQIGTTKRGIGPCYEDKVARVGIRAIDLLNPEVLKAKIEENLLVKNALFEKLFEKEPLKLEDIYQKYLDYGQRLKERIIDSELEINKGIDEGKSVLFEGAQALMLDIDFGTYPYVTSSSPTTGGVCVGAGVPPTKLKNLIGVSKAYCTRVGNGPFPTELHDELGEQIRQIGFEFGASTGRPRRTGWLDLVALRHACMINGITHLVITKLDVLTGIDKIKVCTAYKTEDGKIIDYFTSSTTKLELYEAQYEELEGWTEDISKISTFDELPKTAQDYIHFIENYLGIEVYLVSVGPERSQNIIRTTLF